MQSAMRLLSSSFRFSLRIQRRANCGRGGGAGESLIPRIIIDVKGFVRIAPSIAATTAPTFISTNLSWGFMGTSARSRCLRSCRALRSFEE